LRSAGILSDSAEAGLADCSRGRLALHAVGETPTGQPPGRRRYFFPAFRKLKELCEHNAGGAPAPHWSASHLVAARCTMIVAQMKINTLRFLIVMLALLSPVAADSRPDVHAIAQAVDYHYNHLQTLQAEFAEAYRGAGVERTESGSLWLKKPGKMRWEYRSPKEKLFLSDGKDAWFYLPGDHQVRRTSVKKLDDLRSPLGFLLGKTRLEKELDGLSLAPDMTPLNPGNIVLRGVPKTMADRIREVILEITPDFHIVRIQFEEADESVTEYRFSDQRENVAIADQRFKFAAPPGVEVIDGDFGQ
jgi:outer membrane lipoprotein carrier protein